MTIKLRKTQGQFHIEATNSVITCKCLACGHKAEYIIFDGGATNEVVELRLETYRAVHIQVCPRLVKSKTRV